MVSWWDRLCNDSNQIVVEAQVTIWIPATWWLQLWSPCFSQVYFWVDDVHFWWSKEDLDSASFDGLLFTWSFFCLDIVASIVYSIFMIIVMTKTRMYMRRKYKIEPSCCGDSCWMIVAVHSVVLIVLPFKCCATRMMNTNTHIVAAATLVWLWVHLKLCNVLFSSKFGGKSKGVLYAYQVPRTLWMIAAVCISE